MKIGLLLCSNKEGDDTEQWISISARHLTASFSKYGHDVYLLRASHLVLERDAQGTVVDVRLPDGSSLAEQNLDGILARWSARRELVQAVLHYAEGQGIVTSPNSSTLTRIPGKIAGLKALRAAGVTTPKSLFVEGEFPTEAKIYQALGAPPYVVKADRGTQGLSVFVVYDAREAIARAHKIVEGGRQAGAIIETFIPPPGMDKYECRLLDGGRAIPRVPPEYFRSLVIGNTIHSTIHFQICGSGQWVGNAAQAKTVGAFVELSQEQAAMVLKASAVFGFREAGVDFMRIDEKNIVILEVNHSPELDDHTQLLQYPQTDRRKPGEHALAQPVPQRASAYHSKPNNSNDFIPGTPPADDITRSFCTYVQTMKRSPS